MGGGGRSELVISLLLRVSLDLLELLGKEGEVEDVAAAVA